MIPVVASLLKTVEGKTPHLERVVFVCVQHLMYTTLDIFEALIRLGAKPQNMFLLGKHYSTSPSVVNKASTLGIQVQKLTPLVSLGEYESFFIENVNAMWNAVRQHLQEHGENIDTILVLDDGGRCIKALPRDISSTFPTVAIEQTTAGITQLSAIDIPCAYIDVATSAAKSLEADMVAAAILNKISNILPSAKNNPSIGVIGVGFIGIAVTKKLISLGYNVCIYDSKNKLHSAVTPNTNLPGNVIDFVTKHQLKEISKIFPENHQVLLCELEQQENKTEGMGKIKWMVSLEALIQNADYVFGCTGSDCMQSLDIEKVAHSNKHLISCSSEDKEFLSILKSIQKKNPQNMNPLDPLGDIHWRMKKNAIIHIIKGGFPCNFDNSGISVSANNIQLTRGLILGAILQGIAGLPSYRRNGMKGQIMLDPHFQKFIVLKWLQLEQGKNNPLFANPALKNYVNITWLLANSGGVYHKLPSFADNFTKESSDINLTSVL